LAIGETIKPLAFGLVSRKVTDQGTFGSVPARFFYLCLMVFHPRGG
jgi:hypothetical protein